MKNKGFTLIELLVVIAIVGFVASIILVNTQGVQSKARITKLLEYSQGIQNALGAYAVGTWSFNEGSGTIVVDGSGYGNNGTINGASYTSSTPQAAIGRGTGKFALSFNGTNDVVVLDNAVLKPTSISIEAWVNFSDLSNNQPGIFSIVSKGNETVNTLYWLGYDKRSTTISWFWEVGNGAARDNANIAQTLTANTFYHVVASYNGTNGRLEIYVNGILLNSKNTLLGSMSVDTNSLRIGRYSASVAHYFEGIIDEVRIYERALTLGQVQQLYVQGMERRQDLAINK